MITENTLSWTFCSKLAIYSNFPDCPLELSPPLAHFHGPKMLSLPELKCVWWESDKNALNGWLRQTILVSWPAHIPRSIICILKAMCGRSFRGEESGLTLLTQGERARSRSAHASPHDRGAPEAQQSKVARTCLFSSPVDLLPFKPPRRPNLRSA